MPSRSFWSLTCIPLAVALVQSPVGRKWGRAMPSPSCLPWSWQLWPRGGSCRLLVMLFLHLRPDLFHNVFAAHSITCISMCSLHMRVCMLSRFSRVWLFTYGYSINQCRLKLNYYICKWSNNYVCLLWFACFSENAQGLTMIQYSEVNSIFLFSENRVIQ